MEYLLISACILGKNTKYNGLNNYHPLVEKLKEKYELICCCPEVDGGLSIPRDPSEVVFDKVISIEKESRIAHFARENLKGFQNIEVINADALDFDFESKADLIICEMLDTALIDEEEVPVLNHARRFLKEGGRIIPHSIINVAEPVFMKNHYIQY